MYFTSETTSNGVSERPFTHDGISGLLWTPSGATRRRPLVLLGHGGGQHKRAQGLVARARCYVTRCGFAVAAIDAPGHGDLQRTEQDEQFVAGIRERMSAGEPIGPLIARHNASLAARAVPEWQSTLDALQDVDHVDASGPVGFWGVSLGSAIGVPLAAAEPRITATVFGCAGHEALAEAAAPSRSSSCCSGTTSWRRATPASRSSTPSLPTRRRCTPTRAATRASPRSSWRVHSASSHVISSETSTPRRRTADLRGSSRRTSSALLSKHH